MTLKINHDWTLRLAWQAQERQAQGLWRTRRTLFPVSSSQRGWRDFAGNDYLGLTQDPRLAEAQAAGARRFVASPS